MKNIKQTKDGLAEKSTGCKVVSPLDAKETENIMTEQKIKDRYEKNRKLRESPIYVECFIERLEKLNIMDARHLRKGFLKGELSPVEVYDRGSRLLERKIINDLSVLEDI